MSEQQLIARTGDRPVTPRSLAADLRALGLDGTGEVGSGEPTGAHGPVVLVHTALSAVGWVCGGPVGMIEGLREAVGPSGTIVMPTQTGQLTDPAGWQNPPVPETWWPAIRAETPPYRPDRTPTRFMGAVPECFRALDGVRRSAHPHVSFAALGPDAERILEPHAPEDALGEASPLGRLYALDARVLLLGCGHDSNTSLHLAEYRSRWPGRRLRRTGAPMLVDGGAAWVEWDELETSADDFAELGAELEATTEIVRTGPVGHARARLMPMRPLVDFAVGWLARSRGRDTAPV